jgi:Na+/proline symporter
MTLFSQTQGWLLVALFGALSIGLTMYYTKSSKTKTEFLVANRNLNWFPAGMSIAATWIWAPALFVASQQAYINGWVGVFWFTVPNAFALIFFGWFAQKASRQLPTGFTLSGYVRNRFNKRVQGIYLFNLASLSVMSFAVQLLAGGLILSSLTGIGYLQLILALSFIAVVYSIFSGMNASVLTDYFQMFLIAIVGLVLAPWVAIESGGWATLSKGIHGINDNAYNLFDANGIEVFLTYGLALSIGLISGPFGDQTFWQRAWSTKPSQVKKAFIAGGLIFAIVPITMSILGFAAAGTGLEIENKQLTNLAAVQAFLPTWTVIPFLFFILGGLVSTLDSHLCAIASLFGHDLTKSTDQKQIVRNARIGMVSITVFAIPLALIPGLQIWQFQMFFGTMRASTLIPTILMLVWAKYVHESGVFYGILFALCIGVPMLAYGNVVKDWHFIVAGSLLTIAISGGITYFVSIFKQDEAKLYDQKDRVLVK